MAVLRIAGLPDTALAAAAAFHAVWLERALAHLSPLSLRGEAGGGGGSADIEPDHRPHPNPSPEGEGLLVLIFAPADQTHRSWRLAAVQGLARELAPHRVNALASSDEAAIAAALAYLNAAGGVTGQYLQLDDLGAGLVISSPA